MSSQNQRENFWDYLTSEKSKPRWATKKRLEVIKAEILADDDFWFHVIERFGAEYNAFASRFYESHPKEQTEGSRANFWGMVSERVNRK